MSAGDGKPPRGSQGGLDPLAYELVMRGIRVRAADSRIYYGSHLLQFGDLRLPAGPGPHPVAIVIHGGGWMSTVTLDYMSTVAAALTAAGVATWNIEYRRIGSEGGWPGTFQDAAAAADFVRELAARFPLDPGRVVAIGHSSGGHLALWLAGRRRLTGVANLASEDPLALRGVVSLAGPGDLAGLVSVLPLFKPVVDLLLGGAEGVGRHMKHASPLELLPLGVPQVLINGRVDPIVPLKVQEDYASAAVRAGDDVRAITLQCGHFEPADVEHPEAGPAILDAVLSLTGLPKRRR